MTNRTDILPIQFEDGETFLAQVTMLGGEENVAVFAGGLSLENVTKNIEKISAALAKTVKKVKPDKATIEFGVEIATQEGQLTALLVQGSATANLTISLEWEKEPEKNINEHKSGTAKTTS